MKPNKSKEDWSDLETFVKPQCPKCKGTVILYLKRTNKYLCRRCGEEWPKREEK